MGRINANGWTMAALTLALGLIVGGALGVDHGRALERKAQQETRTYVNDQMGKAGFCRGELLGTLVENCLTKKYGG